VNKVVVVGAGPAGMMAAGIASQAGARVELLEKGARVGRKLAITGKGRCNITTAVPAEELVYAYPGNGKFLHSAFAAFSNHDLIKFLSQRGLETKIERGMRVFPVSNDAHEVVQLFESFAREQGAVIRTSTAVKGLAVEAGVIQGVYTQQGLLKADAVIITTGGLSYPGTGSTGDGYKWARELGHTIITPQPGLVPLITAEKWVKELRGLSLKNVSASSFRADGSKINEEFGEMLFTHFGISGPIILTMSRDIRHYLDQEKSPVKLEIDLKPALDEERLDLRLQRDLNKYSRKMFKNALYDLLPRKFIPIIIDLSGIQAEKACHQITREERMQLVYLLKHVPLTIVGTRPISEAIVTAGGVDTREINPATMQSRLVKGLYFAGEILDVDGYTGGYNLQAAFSTGYLAGKDAAGRRLT
jgi:predicted Rossmann fold flavoprotein